MERRRAIFKARLKRRKHHKKGSFSIQQFLSKAEECVDSFDYLKALKWCRKALRIAPNNVAALETTGAVLLEIGQTDEACEHFQKAVDLRPDSGHAKFMYLGQMSSGEKAVNYFKRGIDLMVKESSCISAASSSSKGATMTLDISNAYCSMAEVYLTDLCFEENAEDECRNCCQKALENDPRNPEAYQLMASFLLSKDENKEARSMLLQGTSLWLSQPADKREDKQSKDPGELQDNSATVSESADIGKSLLDPPPYHSRLSCAKLLMEVEEYERAQLVLEGLLLEDDEVIAVWYLMGWLHYLTQELLPAKECLERVVMLNSKLDCDEEEMIVHAKQLVEELTTELQGSNSKMEEEAESQCKTGEDESMEL